MREGLVFKSCSANCLEFENLLVISSGLLKLRVVTVVIFTTRAVYGDITWQALRHAIIKYIRYIS